MRTLALVIVGLLALSVVADDPENAVGDEKSDDNDADGPAKLNARIPPADVCVYICP